MSGQIHALAALGLGAEPSVIFEEEVFLSPEVVGSFVEEKHSLSLAKTER